MSLPIFSISVFILAISLSINSTDTGAVVVPVSVVPVVPPVVVVSYVVEVVVEDSALTSAVSADTVTSDASSVTLSVVTSPSVV